MLSKVTKERKKRGKKEKVEEGGREWPIVVPFVPSRLVLDNPDNADRTRGGGVEKKREREKRPSSPCGKVPLSLSQSPV